MNETKAPTLVRSEFVLDIVWAVADCAGFQPEFGTSPLLVIPAETYDDMGEPQQITVSVVPGDMLNDQPAQGCGCGADHAG